MLKRSGEVLLPFVGVRLERANLVPFDGTGGAGGGWGVNVLYGEAPPLPLPLNILILTKMAPFLTPQG